MPRSDDDDDRPRNRPWNNKGRDDEDDDRPRRRRDRDDEDEDDRPRRRDRDDDFDRPRQRPAKPSSGLAIAGLILGLLGVFTCGVTGLAGLICSVIALGKPTGRGLAVGGLLASGVGTLVGVGLAVFGFIAYGGAKDRMRDQNNMKQIGLALHSQENMQGGMNAPYAQDPLGTANRDLSFRVGLLPFIEQDSLYRQFDLTQGWKSPRNQPYSNAAIATYTSPYGDERALTQTPYRVFVGGGAMFDEKFNRVPLISVRDGTSNTILMVHAADQVSWAEPRELPYSPNGPLPNIWPKDIPGTHVLMADGSVRLIKKTIPERTLRQLITKADGEAIDPNW